MNPVFFALRNSEYGIYLTSFEYYRIWLNKQYRTMKFVLEKVPGFYGYGSLLIPYELER